jgi:hypothetical protein
MWNGIFGVIECFGVFGKQINSVFFFYLSFFCAVVKCGISFDVIIVCECNLDFPNNVLMCQLHNTLQTFV